MKMGEQADYILEDMMDDPEAFNPPVYICKECGYHNRYGGKCSRCGGDTRMVM